MIGKKEISPPLLQEKQKVSVFPPVIHGPYICDSMGGQISFQVPYPLKHASFILHPKGATSQLPRRDCVHCGLRRLQTSMTWRTWAFPEMPLTLYIPYMPICVGILFHFKRVCTCRSEILIFSRLVNWRE